MVESSIKSPPITNSSGDDMSERITISYQGHGELFEASLRSDNPLNAENTYNWLLRAIRSIGFEQLAVLIEDEKP